MLTTLRIKNLALVADLTVEFQEGLNVITGETGAGKSILLGALNLVLGQRADRTLIRSGQDSCTVEAVFESQRLPTPLTPFLAENGLEPCQDNQLVLKRTFTQAGTNRQFVNGSPTTLNTLAALGDWLVDMHGSHDHQSLLHPAKQLAFLDDYGKLNRWVDAYAQLLQQREALEVAKAELVLDEKTYAQQLDLLRFQTQEIAAAKLDPAEAGHLEADYQRSGNAAKLLHLSQTALELIAGEENSLLTQAGLLGRTLQELHRLDPAAELLLDQQEQLADALQELQHHLSAYVDQIDLDPAHLQALEERLNLVQSLLHKYGRTIPEVVQFGEQARLTLRSLEQREEELARINAELARTDAHLWEIGRALSAERRKVIPKLTRAVAKHLADLGFRQSQLDITIQTENESSGQALRFAPNGLDTIEFQFAPNPGEPARPLRAIASSGEMARVMLALKTALAAEDRIPVLVFDEVDANVGGETAQAVGEKMRRIAVQRQVFCVTHLAPVAAFAQAHYLVSKKLSSGRTISEIQRLDNAARVTELTRMLGGQSEAARKLAETILQANARGADWI
jgi:DNA repair protein RecN (Recombination protein N)